MTTDFGKLRQEAARYIAGVQLPSGAIPWFEGGHLDPWDHVEASIGLDLAGLHDEALRAYRWLATVQNEDGSWWSRYENGESIDRTRDTNFSTYMAVGAWLHFLLTADAEALRELWPAIEGGIEFALDLQGPGGEIYWARDAEGTPWPEALMTGSSSVYLSLRCASEAADALGYPRPSWRQAAERLREALGQRPEAFAQLGRETRRYAMDWYYPVLAGALDRDAGFKRIATRWGDFVTKEWGIRCVSDEPWITVAETCELALALLRLDDARRAADLLTWTTRFRDGDGAFWTGGKPPEGTIWPREKPTWTAGAFVMATSLLEGDDAMKRIFGA
jgi:hypothetical protein